MSEQTATTVRTSDGLHLSGTLVLPDSAHQAAVLVHGGGVTREEGGFFTRLAAGLADAGIASLRFDLRGHGESEGRAWRPKCCGVSPPPSFAFSALSLPPSSFNY